MNETHFWKSIEFLRTIVDRSECTRPQESYEFKVRVTIDGVVEFVLRHSCKMVLRKPVTVAKEGGMHANL